ncbi:karyopherin alpha subunit [Dissophora ornata]|nr:Importin alpha subunit (Karyopherin alpha subunit) (Serine-rich RNA polymerase I suppressor protein) [Dissophora ornata]KAI8604995.1 karyopherin alpha subunit [Dissophora ornata]
MDKIPEHRTQNFKAKSAFAPEELRNRRNELNVELRKQEREESLLKRRNLAIAADSEDSEDEAAPKISSQFYGQLPAMIQGVMSDNVEEQLDATTRFDMILSQRSVLISKNFNPTIDEVIRCGVVPRFVEFLRSSHSAVRIRALSVLTSIASGTSVQTQYLIDVGVVPLFIELINSPVANGAISALGSIAGDGPLTRDIVLREQALTPLLGVFHEDCEASLLRTATWALLNFCGSKPPPDWILISPALGVLAKLIHSSDNSVLVDVCMALSYLSLNSDKSGVKIEAVIQSGVCHRLVELLAHHTAPVQTSALRTIGNIVAGDEFQTQAVIECGALQALLVVLSSPKQRLRELACWTISNITAGSSRQINSVIEAKLIPPLIDILKNADFNTKKEACWAISNATSKREQISQRVNYLVSQGCIKPLCDTLICTDNKIVQPALNGLENILSVGEMEKEATNGVNQYSLCIDECGGTEKIRRLQTHHNTANCETAYRIIDKYFSQ